MPPARRSWRSVASEFGEFYQTLGLQLRSASFSGTPAILPVQQLLKSGVHSRREPEASQIVGQLQLDRDNPRTWQPPMGEGLDAVMIIPGGWALPTGVSRSTGMPRSPVTHPHRSVIAQPTPSPPGCRFTRLLSLSDEPGNSSMLAAR